MFMSTFVTLSVPVKVRSPSKLVVPVPADCVKLAALTMEVQVTSEALVIRISPRVVLLKA
jgi:hypothetical protein